MHRTGMSEMEKLNIQSLKKAEEICVKKAQLYASQTRDPAVQNLFQQTLERGQRHISALDSLLQEANLSGTSGQ